MLFTSYLLLLLVGIPMININDSGVFEVASPYQLDTKVYKCVAKSNLSSIILFGIDAYATIYEPLGITEEDYQFIVIEDPVILTLSSPSALTVHIPEDAITSVSRNEYVSYVTKAMVVNLGAHRIDKTFHTLGEKVVTLVNAQEGVPCNVTFKDITRPHHVTLEEHADIMLSRNNLTTSVTDYTTLLVEKNTEISVLEERIAALGHFITNYIDNCTDTGLCCDGGGTGGSTVPNVSSGEVDVYTDLLYSLGSCTGAKGKFSTFSFYEYAALKR